MATKKTKKKAPKEPEAVDRRGNPIDPPPSKEPGPESTPDPSTGTGGSNLPNAVNPLP